MKFGVGYFMGFFELSDYVGLDIMKFILDGKKKLCIWFIFFKFFVIFVLELV